MMKVVIYTDGACIGNPGPGGWGAVLQRGDERREISGGEPYTTNNRMELTAAVRALQSLSGACEVELRTDSQYVQKGITEWLPKWRQRGGGGLARRKGGAVKNADLWEELDEAAKRHAVEWLWVRGHAGEPGNERADRLAGEAAKSQKNAAKH